MLLVLSAGTQRLLAAEALPRAVREAVVRIVHQLPEEACMGTGTLVARERGVGVVVTCAHLFTEGEGETFVIGADGAPQRAVIVAIDEQNDLACLVISSSTAIIAAVAQARPEIGAQLIWCGYGAEGDFCATQGELADYVTLKGAESNGVLEVTGAARHGDSGGPIFNSRGELVAVIMGTDGEFVDGTHCEILGQFMSQHPVTVELRAKLAALKAVPMPDRMLALAQAFLASDELGLKAEGTGRASTP